MIQNDGFQELALHFLWAVSLKVEITQFTHVGSIAIGLPSAIMPKFYSLSHKFLDSMGGP